MTKALELSQLPSFIEANTTNLVVNASSYSIGSSFVANTTGVYHTGVINSSSISTTGFVGNTTAIIPTSNTILLGSSTRRFVLSANTGDFTGTVTGTTANMSTSVNSALLTVGSSFVANTTGVYHTGTVNAASISVGSNFNTNNTVLTTASNTVTFGTAAYVVANGNVGIGVTSPGSKLSISDATDISMSPTSDGQFRIQGSGYAAAFALDATALNIYHNSGLRGIIFGTNETERMRIDSSGSVSTTSNTVTFGTAAYVVANGNVGIGTSSPSSRLTIGRVSSVEEGGQIDLCRSSDNASAWAIDVYGNTSTPSFRIIDNIAAISRVNINSSGNVGINTSTPAHKLDVSGDINISNTNTYRIGNTAVLYNATSPDSGYVWLTQDSYLSVYGHDIRAPRPASFIKHAAQILFTSYDLNNGSPYGDAIHINSYGDGTGGDPNIILINKGANGVKVARGGWANSTTPSSTQYSSGSIYTLNFTSASDASVKEDIQNITNGIDIVKQLRPVTYEWTDEYILAGFSKNTEEQSFDENGRLLPPTTKVRNVGLIAQEVKEVLPTVVHSNNVSLPGTEEYLLNISYEKIVPHLIAAVKEQQAMIEQMQLEINALKNQT